MSVEITYRLDLLQVDLRSFSASVASFLAREVAKRETIEVAKGFESLPIAPCKRIRIADLGNFCLWNPEFSPLES